MSNFASRNGRKDKTIGASRPHISQRQIDDDVDTRHHPTAVDAAEFTINRDLDRGLNPTSTAYSSTSRVAYPNTAGASVASSNATAFANGNDDSYTTPILNRNRSLVDQMPKSTTSSRGGRDREADNNSKEKSKSKSSRDDDNGREEKRNKRDRREKPSSSQNGEKSRSVKGIAEDQAGDGFVGSPGGEQSNPARLPEHEALSSHVQDQFPGQFPSESAEPYRPPLATNEGGPGLAAEYYGDAGQSVAEQPGFRKQSPSLIIGQEPHLLPASSVAAPPPEPSASGGVGAAASFFSGEFDADEATVSHVEQASSTYSSAPSRPSVGAAPSNLSSLGSAAIGTTAAMSVVAGYAVGNHSSSIQQQDTISSVGTISESTTVTGQRPPSQSQGSYYSASSRPPTSASRPSHADNIPNYAAAAAGVAGLAGAALHNSDHHTAAQASSSQQFAAPVTPRHRHRGPLGALVDFVRDPEGVAQYEEYSEYIGVCRGCFEPGSSPRDAPRRHRTFNRKRSDERIGRTSRVEKNRRESSGDEKRDKNSPSWLSGGIAGYGLGKLSDGLFKQTKDFDDTYSVKSGRYSPENDRKYRNRRGSGDETRRRRRSDDALETGITGDGKSYANNSDIFEAAASRYGRQRQGRSRSRSKTRDRNLMGAAVGAVVGSSIGDLSSRHRNHSSDRTSVKSKRKSRNGSESDGKRTSHRKKEKRGFFSFGSNSSTSSLDKAHSRSGKSSKSKSNDKKAEAALLGLGAAAAALAAADGRSGHRKNGVKELVGRKETKDERLQRPSAEDAGWEDEEDYISEAGSIDSGLAFGGDSDGSSSSKRDRRRRSEMSGKGSLPGRRSSWDNGGPAIAGSNMSPKYYDESSKREKPSPPLQYVDPVPVPDFQHLDERMGASEPFQIRPPLVSHPSEDTPFHQPQPKSRVSSTVYTTQVPYSKNSRPSTDPLTRSPPSNRATRFSEAQVDTRDLKLSRRATLPARFETEDTLNETTRRRKPSLKDDSSTISGVRFALPDDDGSERREKRRRRKEIEKEEHVATERQAKDGDAVREKEGTSSKSNGVVDSSSSSWAVPAAVGLVGAAVGAAAVAEGHTDSKAVETKDERRERRRREKQRESEEDDSRRERRRRERGKDEEETFNKSDRDETREERKARRRADREERERKEREEEALVSRTPRVKFGNLPRRADDFGEEENQTDKQETSSKQETYKHEDYSSFFTPAIDDSSDQQVKISGANADADISFDQSPNFVIAKPRELRDQSGIPEFSPADTFDRFDQSSLKFPWQIPRLRLLYPTPPSTRGSTPIIEPKELPGQDNEDFPEIVPKSDISSVGSQQSDVSRENDISQVKPYEVNDRFTDPPSDDDGERWRRRKPKRIPLSIDQEDSPTDVGAYGNDNSFAAVLAASAEDAGFDPSIVIDNPSYRRRDSPPGSNERNVPGSFDDEDEVPNPGNDRRATSMSERKSPPEERDDDAIVKSIVGQVEEQNLSKISEDPKANDDNISSAKSKKSKKSKKGSRRSVTNDEPPENQGSRALGDKDESREEHKDELRSADASSARSNNDGNAEESQTLNGDGELAGKVVASVAVASSSDASKNTKPSGPKKESIWNRVLGKTTNNSSGPDDDIDLKKDEPAELSRKDSKKGKKSKRKSALSEPSLEDGGEDGTDGGQNEDYRGNRSVNSLPESVAQYLTKESDPEQSQEPVIESFLGERPDPPPPPDIERKLEEPFGMATATIMRDPETYTPSEKPSRWPAEISTSDGSMSPKTVSSPTAVPIYFRRPPVPRARSSSQSPLSSTRIADDGPQTHPTRPRPRSTQFENSKEYRPLWLVERNQSRQEVPRDEIYPPLPSSHSTSRDSSLDSSNRQREYKLPEMSVVSGRDDHGMIEDTENRVLESDLLDSQQPTPTASTFQHTSATHEQPSLPIDRSGSPTKDRTMYSEHDTSNIQLASLAAVVGGTTAYAIHESRKDLESSIQGQSTLKPAKPPVSVEEPAPTMEKDFSNVLNEGEDILPQKKKKKKSKKEIASKEQFSEERDIANPNVLGVFDQEGGFPSSLPAQVVVNQDTIKNMSSSGGPDIANVVARDRELLTDVASKPVAIDVAGIDESHSGNVKGEIAFQSEPPHFPETDTSQETSIYSAADLIISSKEATSSLGKELEPSQLTTPLPQSDDSDLFDAPPRSHVDSSPEPFIEIVPSIIDNTAENIEGTERLETSLVSPPVTDEKRQEEKHATQAVPGADLPEVPQSSGDFVSSELKLEGDKQQHDVIDPIAEGSKDHGAATDEILDFSTKKKGKKGKKLKKVLPSEPLPERRQEDMELRKAQDLSAAQDAALVEPNEIQPVQSSNAILYDSPADAQKIEERDEISISPNVEQNDDDDLKTPSNKKKGKKDKKKKKIASRDEQQLSELISASPKIREYGDHDSSEVVDRDLESDQFVGNHRSSLREEEQAHATDALPPITQGDSLPSFIGKANSGSINSQSQAITSLGDEHLQDAISVPKQIEDDLNESSDKSPVFNKPEHEAVGHGLNKVMPEGTSGGHEDATTSTPIGVDGEAVGDLSEFSNAAVTQHKLSHEDIQLSTGTEIDQPSPSRGIDDAALATPASAENLEPMTENDEKIQESNHAEDRAIEVPQNFQAVEEPKPAGNDQPDEKLPEDENFEEFPVKKSKKDKKGKKSKKVEAPMAEDSISTPTLADEASIAAKDEEPSNFATKASKKDKKGKKKYLSNSNPGPVDQLEDNLGPEQARSVEGSNDMNISPLSIEENDITPFSEPVANSKIEEAEKDDWNEFPVKKSKKDKKGRKSLLNSIIGLQPPELTENSTPDERRTLPGGKGLVIEPPEKHPAAFVEEAKEPDVVEEKQKGEPYDEAFVPSKTKNGKKKAKKTKTFSWDDDADQPAKGEDSNDRLEPAQPTGLPTDANEDADEVNKQLAKEVHEDQREEHDKSKVATELENPDDARKGKNFSWGAFELKGPETEAIAATRVLEDDASTGQFLQDQSHTKDTREADSVPMILRSMDNNMLASEGSPVDPKMDGRPETDVFNKYTFSRKSETAKESWDNKAPTKEKSMALPETTLDIEHPKSPIHVRSDSVETPTVERTQSSLNEANTLSGPITSAVQSPSDIPPQLTFDDIVMPDTVEEPRDSQAQEKLPEELNEYPPTREIEETMVDPEFATVKKSKKGKKSKKNKTIDLESIKLTEHEQDQRDEMENREIEPEENEVVREEREGDTPSNREGEIKDGRATKEIKNVRKSVHINDSPEIIEQPNSQSPEASSHRKFSPPDTPLSAGSVDMLDPEQQREYNEEYRKQLQKELGPLQEDNGTLESKEPTVEDTEDRREPEHQLGSSHDGDQGLLQTDLEDPRVLDHGVARETDQSVLATMETSPRETSLAAIPEEREAQSNSSLLQKASTGDDDRLERKKSKKGKKSKQSRKPVIWEDDTVTKGFAGGEEESFENNEEFDGRGKEGKAQDEGRVVYDDLPSPTRGSPSASRSPKYDDAAEDYFAVKPRAEAEKNVGTTADFDQPSPEQLQNLPDWSSQPKELQGTLHEAERDDDIPIPKQRSRRERSLSGDRRYSDKLGSPDRAPHVSSPSRESQSIAPDKSESVGEIAVAVAAGAGIIGATAISREGSKKKKDKKGKKRISKVDLDNDRSEEQQEQLEGLTDVLERHDSTMSTDRIPGQYHETPSQSPERLISSRLSPQESQQEEPPNYRDSAIQITDSPVVPVPELIHRPQHDSGYPATEASPVINDNKDYTQEEQDIVDPYTDPRISTTGFYREDEERPLSIASDPRHSVVESDDQEAPNDRRRSRRRRRRRESNVAYDSDDSNDSGYDKQRRLRKVRQTEELREPSRVSSTTKNRSSVLFDSSPSDRQKLEQHSGDILARDRINDENTSPEASRAHEEALLMAEHQSSEAHDDTYKSMEPPKSIFGGPFKGEDRSRSRSPTNSDVRSRRQLEKISEDSLENSPLARKGKRDVGDVGLPDTGVKARRTSHDLSPLMTGAAAGTFAMGGEDLLKRLHKTSQDDDNHSVDTDRSMNRDHLDRPRRLSNQSNTSTLARDSEWRRQAINSPDSIHAIIRTPPSQVRSSSGQSIRSSGTPPLRRVDRSISGDLRGASKEIDAKRRAKLAEAEPAILGIAAATIASSSTYDPLTDKGKNRGDMADIYEGDGQRGQSPMSPTRPPSMRKRQSMQFADLEQRFEQLAADHRSLQSAKSTAERRLDEQARDHSQQRKTYEEALQEHKSYLAEKNSELSRLHEILDGFKRQVAELNTVNEELQTSHGLDPDRVGDQSFQILAGQHETTKKELEDLREQHTRLANDHEDMLEREIEAVRQEKDYELQQLVVELENAKEEVKALQQQILASLSADGYIERDEDYFESKCNSLCQHVQQWVLRFSKFSDSHACRLVGELGDDTLSDLFDDTILDGTEADDYLQDRIKRRDVFMSVVMSRIFDFIFRRYLFGLDREQRKKLKDLEATLTDVGPQSAVHKWRSTTLTLLSSRPEFADQREEDTEGVVDSIFQTLAAILPPKRDLIPQITDSLRRVISMAVDLHIEMRLQRAEFQMLPPLKPQFDPITGDLVRKVPFNATMMNERSGNTESNEQLQEEGAVSRMVLFPLVVKNSDEEEQIVVCPAQVIVARDEPKKRGNGKQVRVMSAQGARSEASFVGTEDTRMSVEGEMF